VDVARHGVAIALERHAEQRVHAAAKLVEDIVKRDEPVYGINTGFGDLATERIPAADLKVLQRNLVRSHAVGVGDPLPADVVRAAMLLRANTLAAGRSGVRGETLRLLIDMLDRGVLPVMPMHGSVGASGDLAPLAHMALVLIGEGEAIHDGKRKSAADALKHADLKPLELGPKEGLSLINGTQVMTAIGCLALHDAEVLATSADVISAMSAEALRATDQAWDEAIHDARPHPGQRAVAANLRALVTGSPIRESHRSGDPRVQDPYSVRCIPQVHGAARDALGYVRRVLVTEINAVTDNPLVFPEDGRVLSGGNFHGQPVSLALDLAAIAVAQLGVIAEARIDRLTNGHTSGLAPFLTLRPGSNSGFMVAQYTAAALVAEVRLRALPASIQSIPTSAGMEDHVSMGVHAAHQLAAIVRSVRDILSIEALCAAQGLDLLRMRSSEPLEAARQIVREQSPFLDDDRSLSSDIARTSDAIAREVLVAGVRRRLEELT
jgi:histidine ammonia-lyase